MPRFFFHSKDGNSFVDKDGVELENMLCARNHAVLIHSELMRDMGPGETGLSLTVTDDRGLILLRIETALTQAPALGQARPTGQ